MGIFIDLTAVNPFMCCIIYCCLNRC